jgi:hypothetical protein
VLIALADLLTICNCGCSVGLGAADQRSKKTLRQIVTVLDINNPPASDEEGKQALHLPTNPAIKEIKEADKAKDQLICELQQQEQKRQDLSKGYCSGVGTAHMQEDLKD